MIYNASFEDFLYILAGLVWLVFSIYNANKKKKAKENKKPNPQRESPPNFLDSIMDELGIDKSEQEPAENQTVYEPYTYEEDELLVKNETNNTHKPDTTTYDREPFSYDDYYEESNYSEISDVKEKDELIKTRVKIDLSTKKSTTKKSRKVNLKKAVIYSEILNKRYF